MRTEVIKADTIDAAAERILDELKEENDDLFLGMMKKMELFDFSGNRIITKKSLTMAANNISLLVETIIIDEGCVGLEQVSFRGCAKLKNVLLRGLFEELKSIDISGTAVKTLDLGAMVALSLDEFVALGCDKLCAILWPPKQNMRRYFSRLRIDTTVEDSINATSSLSEKYGSRAPTEYDWYVSVKDARLLRSLVAFKDYFNDDDAKKSQEEQVITTDVVMIEFPALKRIHLHELPMLQGICGCGRMYAPNLESIKIRGCRLLVAAAITTRWSATAKRNGGTSSSGTTRSRKTTTSPPTRGTTKRPCLGALCSDNKLQQDMFFFFLHMPLHGRPVTASCWWLCFDLTGCFFFERPPPHFL